MRRVGLAELEVGVKHHGYNVPNSGHRRTTGQRVIASVKALVPTSPSPTILWRRLDHAVGRE
jgi:hypothetical protein